MSLTIRPLTGEALAAALPEVARLRIAVFRAWPYLYDGDPAYEEAYLQSYRESAEALVVGAYDGETLVGASTGTPLTDHADDFAAAFFRHRAGSVPYFLLRGKRTFTGLPGQGCRPPLL